MIWADWSLTFGELGAHSADMSRTLAELGFGRADRLAAWADDMQRTRPLWFLRSPLRAVGRLRRPPVDAIGTYAVHAVRRHTDQTHAAVLALVDELLAMGVRDDRVPARVVAARERVLDTTA